MADAKSVIRNLGKSVAYTTLNVLRPAAPNIFNTADAVKSGFRDLQDFISENKAKIPIQVNREELRSKARRLMDETIRDIKKGNLALGDIMDDDYFDNMYDEYDENNDWESSDDGSETESAEDARSAISDGIRMTSESVITGAKAQLEGMQVMTDTLSKTQLKSAQYQTRILHETILSSAGAIMNTMNRMDNRLVSINNNIAMLVKGQEAQATTNQAMMTFFQQTTDFMKRMDASAAERRKRQNTRRRDSAIDFMLGDGFDIDTYKKVLKSNLNNSSLGMAAAMLPMLSTLPEMMSMGGKFQPQKYALQAMIKLLIPKSARRSIEQADMSLSNMVKNQLLALGKRKYDGTLPGLLGEFFGIDMRTSKNMRFGDFRREEMSWNGESQKVLTQIIPKQLAEIKAAIINGYSENPVEPEYYDADTGRMMKRSEVKARATALRRQAQEQPFAHLLNPVGSLDIREQRTAKMWAAAAKQDKIALERLINDAIRSGSGFDQATKQKVYTIYMGIMSKLQAAGEQINRGDVDRIVEKINKAVNVALVNDMETARNFSRTDSAISQVLMDYADPITGQISLDDAIGYQKNRIRQANAGANSIYTRGGKAKEFMSEMERLRAQAADASVYGAGEYIEGMMKNQNILISTFGKAMNAMVRLWNGAPKVTKDANGNTIVKENGIAQAVESATSAFYVKINKLDPTAPNTKQLMQIYKEYGAALSKPSSMSISGKRFTIKRSPATSSAIAETSVSAEEIAGVSSGASVNGNQSYRSAISTDQGNLSERRTADALEQMQQTTEETLGKNGVIRKLYEDRIKNTAVGKTVDKIKSSAIDYGKKLWSEPYVDKDGVEHASIKEELAKGVTSVTEGMSAMVFGDDAEKAANAKEAASKQAKNILANINNAVRKYAPKALAGGIAGGAIGFGVKALSGGSMGILGNLFLPGGAIGGAILGSSLMLASHSDKFKNFMFGEKDDDGKRTGGLIKKEWADSMKKAAPALIGGGLAGGVLASTIGKAVGGTVVGQAAGFLPGLFLPGGAIGGVLMGAAAGLALKSDRVSKVLFGEKDENGKRTGSILSSAYNAVSQKLLNFKAGKGGSLAKRVLAGAGAGLLTHTAISQMGVVGSALGVGGPIGAAMLGGAIGIASVGDKFNKFLFGSEIERDGKKMNDGTGFISRFQTMLDVNLFQPMGQGFLDTAEEFAAWAKMKIEVPFRLAFGPIIDGFTALKEDAKDGVHSMLERIEGGFQKILEGIFSPIGEFVKSKLLAPLGKVVGNVLKTGLYMGGAMVSTPLQMLSMITSGKRRKEMVNFNRYANAHESEFLGEDAGFAERLAWNLGKLPGMAGLVMGKGREAALQKYADDEMWKYRYNEDGSMRMKTRNDGTIELDDDGNPKHLEMTGDIRNNLGWMTARLDRRKYKNDWKNIKARNKTYRKARNQAAKWARTDGYNSQRELTDHEFAQRQETLRRLGIDIADQDEMREFTFNNTAWRNKRDNPSAIREEAAVAAERDDVSWIRKGVEKLIDIFTGNAKTNEEAASAIQDIAGKTLTKEEQAATVAKGMDEAKKKEEAREKATATQSVITGLNSQKDEEKAESAIVEAATGETGEKKKGGILSVIGDVAGKIFSSPIAIAAAIGTVLAIPGVSNLLKTVIGGIGDVAKKAFTGLTDTMGYTAENTDKRISGYDENGNPEIVKNGTLSVGKIAQVATGNLTRSAVKLSGNIIEEAAKRGTTTAATTLVAMGRDNVIMKALDMLKSLFAKGADKFLKKNGSSLVGKALQSVSKVFSKIYSAIDDKVLKTWAPKVAKALGLGAIQDGAKFTPAVIVQAAYSGLVAIKGAVQAERLFDVNKDDLDWKMRAISGMFELITGTNTPGLVFTVISELAKAVCGFDLPKTIAVGIYNAISSDADKAALDQAMKDFDEEVKNYNAANGTNLSTDAYRDMKTKDQGWWSSVKNFFTGKKAPDYSQYEVQHSEGRGDSALRRSSVTVGYGMSQYDPRWANRTIGMLPNGRISTMADGGCGPTAVANAAAALGRGISPGLVGGFAATNGYISNGGANAGLFDQGVNAFGMQSQRISDSGDIKRSLMNGRPVILSGKAAGYGTPYTGVGHIVTATGIDRDGKVIVQDPRYGRPQKHSMGELTRGMTNGWSMRPVGYGVLDTLSNAFSQVANQISSAIFGMPLSGDDATDINTTGSAINIAASGNYKTYNATESSNKIWKFLKSQGFTDEAIAGIMGCWQIESGNKANVFEGYYLQGAKDRGFSKIFASNASLNEYMQNVLIPAYKKSNINISVNGYKGSDGNFYPGLGLAQWTGPRAYQLFKWANEHGKDWRDLDTQLEYFMVEAKQRGLKDILNKASSPEHGARLALDNYEMYPGWSDKPGGKKHLADRAPQAGAIYRKYHGAVGYGLFDQLTGAFTEAANSISRSIFGDDWTSSGTTTEGSDGTTSTNYTSVAGANTTQSKLVNFLRNKQKSLNYSQEWNRQDPDTQNSPKASSCAATVGWAYKNVLGGDFAKNKMSASSTAQSQDKRFTTVFQSAIRKDGTGTGSIDESVLQPGDVLYYRRSNSTSPYKMGHTEMYIGGGKRIGHGGPSWSDMGPNIKDLTRDESNLIMARRYNGFIGQDPAIGKGAAPIGYGSDFNMLTSGRIPRTPVGYGSNYTLNMDQTGVESRLDRLIALMESIDRKTPSGGKAGPSIGRGDTSLVINQDKSPKVVVQQPDEPRGKPSSGAMKNSGLRSMHQKFAAKK